MNTSQTTKAEELAAIWDTYSNGDQFQEASEMTAELLRSLSQQPPAHGITPFNPLNAASNVDMRLPQPPAVSDDKPEPDYKAMFHRAVTDIALIEEALGIPEEESGKSAHRLAEAAKELRRQVFSYESMVADRDEWLAKYGEVIKNAHEALVFATDRMMELTDDQYPIIEDAIDRAKNTIDAMREGDPS
ncbi:MAG: hypothetical protein H5T98_00920 [Syntrophomonadaceae bacterium]|nr:hypothetical protein [Syntrophomonadaceae bacterium]